MPRSGIAAVLAVFVVLTVVLGASTAYLLVSPPSEVHTTTITSVSSVNQGATTVSLQGSSGASVGIAYKPGIGFYLVDGSGMTLYFRTSDDHTTGMSSCMGQCANIWPAFFVQNLVLPPGLNATSFAMMTRSDGMKQMDYNGWPLYHYSGDSVPGDVKGQGIGGVWFAYGLPSPSQSPSNSTTSLVSTTDMMTSSSSSSHCMGYYC